MSKSTIKSKAAEHHQGNTVPATLQVEFADIERGAQLPIIFDLPQ